MVAANVNAAPAALRQERVNWHDPEVWRESGFAAFLRDHGIRRSDLVAVETDGQERPMERRFFRVKCHQSGDADETLNDDEVIERVAQSLLDEGLEGIRPEAVDWVPGFFSLPASTPLARIGMYQRGALYGIDISSGYAVTLLDVQPGEHVLDLCCAPGAKLTMIADLLQMRGSVTGVDFSRQRLGACRQLVHKYRLLRPDATAARAPTSAAPTDAGGASKAIAEGESHSSPLTTETATWRCRLFHADGRTFNIGPKTECARPEDMELVLDTDEIASRDAKSQGRKRKNKSARAREAKRQRLLVHNAALYDKVLVDAECTHDGSIKHLQKLETAGAWAEYVSEHLGASEITRILALQRDLIRNGFGLLRPGGTMIYSTCSLSVKQNEDIVRAFLAEHPTAELQAIDPTGIPCECGQIPGTVRFTPAHHTSGLFIAKIVKRDLGIANNPGSP